MSQWCVRPITLKYTSPARIRTLQKANSARTPAKLQASADVSTRLRAESLGEMPAAAILDVDGTLVDTNYQHAIAWYRAFRQHDVVPPIWRIHRHIGMGGDQLVAAVAGEEIESEKGDDIRSAEKPLYMAMIEEVEPFEGARELIRELKERGHAVVLASSAKQDEVDRYLDLLEARELADGWTTSADVEATKPEPDLIKAALEKAGGGEAVMIGDSTWDCEAARRAGLETIAVLTGGFSEQELRDAGAAVVFEAVGGLRGRIDETPLGTG
jgi:HAD superfamily hydrolase (TIGR01549 family)